AVSGLPAGEVAVHPQPGGCALFWVELYGKNIAVRNGAAERQAVVADAGRERRVVGDGVIAVDEIERRVLGDAFPERVGAGLRDGVPAHVGDFQALAAVGGVVEGRPLEAAHAAGKQAQAGGVAFVAGLEQHLFAHAHAQQRFFAGGLQHGFAQPGRIQRAHAVGHGALSREHDAVGGADFVGAAGDADVVVGGGGLQGAGDGMEIAHAVVDDGDAGPDAEVLGRSMETRNRDYSEPLVEGMAPPARGSTSVAMRSARPKALKMVSHWWWAFSPRRLSMCTVARAWLTKPWKNSRARSTSNVPMRARA